MRSVFRLLCVAAVAATLPCVSWAASKLPDPLVRFAFAEDNLTNTGTRSLQSLPTLAEGFTFGEVSDVNGVGRRALKSTGSAVTNVDLAAENIAVSGSTISFWTTTTTQNWRDAVGVDFLFDPAESSRTWQAWERKDEKEMAVYGVTGPSGVDVGDTAKLHHWAMVGEGTWLTFYFDGRYLGRYDKSAQITAGSVLAAFGFGGSAARNAQLGIASTADARIYDIPLSPAKVAFLASGETLGVCEASVEGDRTFDELTWDDGEGYVEGTTSVMGLRLASGATLTLNRTLTLDRLFLVVSEGSASLRLSGEGALSAVGEVIVLGDVDFGPAAIPSLNIVAGATATVEARDQITALSQAETGTLRLAGGEALGALSVDAAVAEGRTLAVAKTVTTEGLPISGRTLDIESGADITVTTQFRTAHGNQGGDSVIRHTGGTLTCSGPASSDYKTGAFVLSHWPHTTNYSLSGGTLNVTESAAKLGADGTGNLTVSGDGVANFHSVSIRRGTLTVATGGTVNLGAASVASAADVVTRGADGALALAGGTLGPWARTDLSLAGPITVSADTTVRTSPSKEGVSGPATVSFTGALSGAGGLLAEGPGTLDLSAATALCEGGLSVGAGTTVRVGVWRPTLHAFGAGATLALEATAAEIVAGRIDFPRGEGVSLAGASVTVSNVPEATVGEDGVILLPSAKPKWTAGADNNTWSNLDRWTNLGEDGIPTAGEVLVDFGAGPESVTLTVDAAVALTSLTVSGEAAGAIVLGEGGALTASEALRAATDVALPAVSLAPAAEIAEGKTLTLTGDREALEAAFTGGGNLRFAGGAVRQSGAGCDFSGVAELSIGAGATLDLNGLSNAHAVILDGGTLANTAATAVTAGAVTLASDSFVLAEGDLSLRAAGDARDDLTLAGHALEKSGGALLSVMGAELGAGTLSVQAGALKLDTTGGGDCTLNGTTLRFAEGTSYTAYGWVGLSGTVTVETAAGADVAFTGITLSGDGNLTKTGAGALTVELKATANTQPYAGETRVEAGTLTFRRDSATSKSGKIVIAAGATLRKTGSGTLTYAGRISGAGDCEVAEGTVIAGEANGDFSGTWRVAAGATLSDEGNYNYNPFFGEGGAMVVDGTLELRPTDAGNPGNAHVSGPISGTGTVSVRTDASIAGAVSLTGTLEIAEGVTLRDVTSIDGPGIRCAGVLAPASASVVVARDKTLSGTGTIQGTVTFAEGSALDATAGALTVGSAALPEAAGQVTLRVAAEAAVGTEVLRFASPVSSETFKAEAFSVEGPSLAVALNAGGTALVLTSGVTLPESVGSDGGTLSEAAAQALSEAAKRLGVDTVVSVTGRSGGRALTSDELSGALECFTGDGLVASDAADGGVSLTVAYDFGITAMAYDPANKTFSVTVRVQGASDGATVTFAAGVTVALFCPSDDSQETCLSSGTAAEDADTVTLTLSFSDAESCILARKPLKVRVSKDAASAP